MTDIGLRMYRFTGMALLSFGAFLTLSGPAIAADTNVAGSGAADRQVTFAKDVAPILQERCQECHHAGSMAPMSLVTYEETRPWAKAIRDRVSTRQMPPWHIDATVGVQKFKNDMSLSQAQIYPLVSWVDQGALLGNSKDMPAPREWRNAAVWKGAKELGSPDIVVKSTDWAMPAHHQDVWWRPTTDIGLTEP